VVQNTGCELRLFRDVMGPHAEESIELDNYHIDR
jgi:hypothetical protein